MRRDAYRIGSPARCCATTPGTWGGVFSDEFLRVDASAPAVRLQQVTNLHATPEFTLEQVVAGVPWQQRG